MFVGDCEVLEGDLAAGDASTFVGVVVFTCESDDLERVPDIVIGDADFKEGIPCRGAPGPRMKLAGRVSSAEEDFRISLSPLLEAKDAVCSIDTEPRETVFNFRSFSPTSSDMDCDSPPNFCSISTNDVKLKWK